MKKFIVTLGLLLNACATTADYQGVTSGRVGCPPGEIAISDEVMETGRYAAWTAECRGKKFFCSATNGNTQCSEAAPAKP